MRKMRNILIISLLALSYSTQAQCEQFKSQIISLYEQMNMSEKPNKGEAYYMRCTMKFYPNSKDINSTQSHISIYVDNEQNYYKSEQMDYFQDESEIYLVIHHQKKIYKKPSFTAGEQMRKWNILYLYRDSLIKESEVVSCQQVFNKPNQKVIVMEPSHKRAKQSKIASIEFTIDIEKNQLTKMTINYDEGYKVAKAETVYEVINLHAKESKYNKAKNHVLDGQGRLREQYQNFEIIEHS